MILWRVRRRRWDVLAACSQRGDCQVLQFLASLEGPLAKQGVRMLALLTQVAEEGIPRNTERAHKIAGPIWELIHADLRILFFVDAGQVVVCAAAFVKKSRKVPRIEISRAEAVESRYQESKHAGRLTVEEESE